MKLCVVHTLNDNNKSYSLHATAMVILTTAFPWEKITHAEKPLKTSCKYHQLHLLDCLNTVKQAEHLQQTFVYRNQTATRCCQLAGRSHQ